MTNPELNLLQPYPFEKLRVLLNDITPGEKRAISLSVGEPKHPAPQLVLDAMTDSLRAMEQYPSTRGNLELRQSIANWLSHRFGLKNPAGLAENSILPVNGTREGLFAIAQACKI